MDIAESPLDMAVENNDLEASNNCASSEGAGEIDEGGISVSMSDKHNEVDSPGLENGLPVTPDVDDNEQNQDDFLDGFFAVFR